LLNFMKDYFNIFIDGWFLSWYGSYWHFSFPNVLWFLLIFVALTDRNEADRLTSSAKQKILSAFIIFSCVAFFSTALYIGFTEVGAPHIAGVQKDT